ncbi:hypothetical protein C7382_10876 [Porphyromonas loveana]|uniref:Uncharacterized protein n=1 Tax=Porphyromonas loveana TaxID=1884669 RepID=A0A2U1FCG8_9PORP|nr:hypothetical protein C7382_10876 [Porphyromonas loveana]
MTNAPRSSFGNSRGVLFCVRLRTMFLELADYLHHLFAQSDGVALSDEDNTTE